MAYKYPGEISIEQIIVTSPNNQAIDITPQVVEINIFESIFSNTLTAKIALVDSQHIISKLPIVGYESVDITLSSPNTEKFTVSFVVYKVSNRAGFNQKTEAYILELISYEAYLDQRQSISKSFNGPIHEIVSSIHSKYLAGRQKSVFLEHTSNSAKFISPYWSPFQMINWLCNRAIPKTGKIPSYFFWETVKGFRFEAIDTNFTNDIVASYVNRPGKINFSKDNINNKMTTIVDYKVLESASSLELLSNGAFGSREFIKDISKNEYTKKEFSYSDMFKKSYHLNNNSFLPVTDVYSRPLDTPNKTRMLNTTGLPDSNSYADWILERKSFIEQLGVHRLEILVYGNFKISVGSVVEVSFAEDDSELDDYLSGRYMVIGLNHIIQNSSKHMMSLELMSESYPTAGHYSSQMNTTRKVTG